VTTPVVDVHGHTLDLAFFTGRPLNGPLGGTTDVPQMHAGGVTAQLNLCWTPDMALSGPHDHSVADPPATLGKMLDYLDAQLAGPDGADVVVARYAGDLTAAADRGQVALVLGMEGTDAIRDDPARLAALHARGLRHICLVHEHDNAFGSASQVWRDGDMFRSDETGGDLTSLGGELLDEIRRLGFLLDVTHLLPPAFWHVLERWDRPVVVSHGGARALTDSPRYLTDDQIRAIAATGGLIGASPSPLGPSDEAPGLDLLLDTADDLARVAGPEHVGIGTDFKDQVGYYPDPLPDISAFPAIRRGLAARGHDQATIDGILGGNFVRVFAAAVG
jgi:membrane dipeptidase